MNSVSKLNWGTPVAIYSKEKHGNARVYNQNKYAYISWCRNNLSSEGVLWRFFSNEFYQCRDSEFNNNNDDVFIHFAQPQDAVMFRLMFNL